jgi:hypothetical protein
VHQDVDRDHAAADFEPAAPVFALFSLIAELVFIKEPYFIEFSRNRAAASSFTRVYRRVMPA